MRIINSEESAMDLESNRDIELSIVLPCLNEEKTIGKCIEKIKEIIEQNNIKAEIIVADNNSTDNSRIIAEKLGAKVVTVLEKGYGNALRKGFAESQGKYIIFFDSDLSYDPADLPKILEKLRAGYQLVIGSRIKGKIAKNAMPFLHRYIGTPMMTFLANILFKTKISDINSGMRGVTREALRKLDLHSEGMEFASEMVAKAKWAGVNIVEVPISFYPDQRGRRPHLRTLRDGWRHLQLMFHFSSLGWFLIPGTLLSTLSYLLVVTMSNRTYPLLLYFTGLVLNVIGTQILLIGVIAQGRVKGSKFKYKPSNFLKLFSKVIKVEIGTLLGTTGCIISGILSILSGIFNYQTLFFLFSLAFIQSIQILFSSILIGLFGVRVSEEEEFFS
ncbi:MAG: glycosyltransferase family 2 protein [Candidatus Hydrogenedentes bacterium]|nr:glycosyltransferase family 2 protein [Candidatus Hydrogenedentota bacterium]